MIAFWTTCSRASGHRDDRDVVDPGQRVDTGAVAHVGRIGAAVGVDVHVGQVVVAVRKRPVQPQGHARQAQVGRAGEVEAVVVAGEVRQAKKIREPGARALVRGPVEAADDGRAVAGMRGILGEAVEDLARGDASVLVQQFDGQGEFLAGNDVADLQRSIGAAGQLDLDPVHAGDVLPRDLGRATDDADDRSGVEPDAGAQSHRAVAGTGSHGHGGFAERCGGGADAQTIGPDALVAGMGAEERHLLADHHAGGVDRGGRCRADAELRDDRAHDVELAGRRRADGDDVSVRDTSRVAHANDRGSERPVAVHRGGRGAVGHGHHDELDGGLRVIEEQRALVDIGRRVGRDRHELGHGVVVGLADAQHLTRGQGGYRGAVERESATRVHVAGHAGGQVGTFDGHVLQRHRLGIGLRGVQRAGQRQPHRDGVAIGGDVFAARPVRQEQRVAVGDVRSVVDLQQRRAQPCAVRQGRRGWRLGFVPEEVDRGVSGIRPDDPVDVDPPRAVVEGALDRVGEGVAVGGVDGAVQEPAEGPREVTVTRDQGRTVYGPACGHPHHPDGRGRDASDGFGTARNLFDEYAGCEIFWHVWSP